MRAHAALVTALCAALVAGAALAQDAGPAPPSLPDPAGLPSAPADLGLPGVDARQCGTSRWSALCAVGRWSQYSTMDVTLHATGVTGSYHLEQAANGEVHATYRETVGGRRRGGEVVLFGTEGIAYRTRDALPPADRIIDYMLSAPLMLGRLAAVLLDQGVLGAPSEVAGMQAIRASGATQFIRTDAPRMSALYGPPWSMTGSVRPAGDGRVGFALTLRYRPVDARGALVEGRTDTVRLEGTASYAPMRGKLPDTFDLVGWKLMRVEQPIDAASTLDQARLQLGPS